MPIYEFRCVNCGNVQEIIVSSSDQQVEMKCRECNGEDLERIMSCTNYSMGEGSSSRGSSGATATTRNCGPNSSCTSIELPGYTKS